eukprot:s5830_g7.t1
MCQTSLRRYSTITCYNRRTKKSSRSSLPNPKKNSWVWGGGGLPRKPQAIARLPGPEDEMNSALRGLRRGPKVYVDDMLGRLLLQNSSCLRNMTHWSPVFVGLALLVQVHFALGLRPEQFQKVVEEATAKTVEPGNPTLYCCHDWDAKENKCCQQQCASSLDLPMWGEPGRGLVQGLASFLLRLAGLQVFWSRQEASAGCSILRFQLVSCLIDPVRFPMARLAAYVLACGLLIAGAMRPDASSVSQDQLLKMIQNLQGRVAVLEGQHGTKSRTSLCCSIHDENGEFDNYCTADAEASCGSTNTEKTFRVRVDNEFCAGEETCFPFNGRGVDHAGVDDVTFCQSMPDQILLHREGCPHA